MSDIWITIVIQLPLCLFPNISSYLALWLSSKCEVPNESLDGRSCHKSFILRKSVVPKDDWMTSLRVTLDREEGLLEF